MVLAALTAARLGLVSAGRSRAAGLPVNPQLRAHNVHEVSVDPAMIDAARTFYQQHIAARLAEHGGFASSNGLAFYVKRPEGWSSDIGWYSADNEKAYRHFETEFFRTLPLADPFHRLVDIDRGLRMYCPFFVVRSRCDRTRFHRDYGWNMGTNAYTLMTPLEDMASVPDGHLAYLDTWGRRRIYRYRKGTAVILGAGFTHGTQPVASGPPRAFLCFTFGSDKDQYWPVVKKTIGHQSRMICRPDGTLVRDSHASTTSYA